MTIPIQSVPNLTAKITTAPTDVPCDADRSDTVAVAAAADTPAAIRMQVGRDRRLTMSVAVGIG